VRRPQRIFRRERRRRHVHCAASAAVMVRTEDVVPQVVVTVAVNEAVPPGGSVICAGLTATARILSEMAMGATAVFVGSALLVATMWYVPASSGAL
jgi:NAD(P)H-dependent flavin oxidoreductase YrpB (nitropropane dioxygenase family)